MSETTLSVAAWPDSQDGRPAGSRSIREELARAAPGRSWHELLRWPPDVFAVASALLADSGAYRCVVCPPEGRIWPPVDLLPAGGDWEGAVRRWATDWAASAGALGAPPDAVARLGDTLEAAGDTRLTELDDERNWATLSAVLGLHAAADEASAGAGLVATSAFLERAALLLARTGSLAQLDTDRARVLPKLRPPEAGITLRSLSHHLALDRSEVETRWYLAAQAPGAAETGAPKLTLLLVPYPATVHASDFHPVGGPLANMDESRYAFYDFVPQEPLDPVEIVAMVEQARRHVGSVDAVVLPEAALDEQGARAVQRLLWEAGVPYLIAGVREPAHAPGTFGGNYAHFGGRDWQAPRQYKHHRWCLDASQIHQYHLGAALDPGRRWWEAIAVRRRSLTFVTVSDWLTVCPLVCEDLARPDPVTDVIRAVAPTLVVALLLDGPQLKSRWPARYASVLADDPGSSVLTLTALGMATRSNPPGFEPSRVIALWKDPHRGLQEITLADQARAVAVTAHVRTVPATTADGRSGASPVSELVLTGIEQIA